MQFENNIETEIVVGFDFECAGGIPSKHGFTQLGASAHLFKTEEKIAEFNQYSNMKGYEWEERCVEEFWKKNPERYEETLDSTDIAMHSCHEVVANFVDWIRDLAKDRTCVVVSDNMIYDGGALKYFADVDVIYLLGKGRYTPCYETSSVYYGIYSAIMNKPLCYETRNMSSKTAVLQALSMKLGKPVEWPKMDVKHDHHPANDAETMVRQWMFVQKSLNQ